jgi:hypothetical protein
VSPDGQTITALLPNLTMPAGPAFDRQGDLYVTNGSTVSRASLGTLTVLSSQPPRPMSIGGADNAVAGINLTAAELAGLTAAFAFGDPTQTGDITLTTATLPGRLVLFGPTPKQFLGRARLLPRPSPQRQQGTPSRPCWRCGLLSQHRDTPVSAGRDGLALLLLPFPAARSCLAPRSFSPQAGSAPGPTRDHSCTWDRDGVAPAAPVSVLLPAATNTQASLFIPNPNVPAGTVLPPTQVMVLVTTVKKHGKKFLELLVVNNTGSFIQGRLVLSGLSPQQYGKLLGLGKQQLKNLPTFDGAPAIDLFLLSDSVQTVQVPAGSGFLPVVVAGW